MNACRTSLRTLPILLLIALAALASSCGDTPESRVRNFPPSVHITGGPPEGHEDSYLARVWWTGWDDDGFIVHYEYAVDPPAAFSPDEIDSPETSPGVSILTIRGPEEGADTLRVSKTVDGVLASFDFVQTREFSRSFALTTTHADSGYSGSSRVALPRFSGAHRIYIRALDNEGLYSIPDHLGYTATTVTPTSRIVRPKTNKEILNVGPQISIHWEGDDPDSPDAIHRPVAYLYKLVQLDALTPPIRLLSARDPVFIADVAAARIPWTRQSAETLSADFFLQTGGSYMFAIRAVDRAGAVEPFLSFSRGNDAGANAFLFQSLLTGGSPVVTVTEPSLGTYTARAQGAVTYDVPIGVRLRFSWSADAVDYGGTIEAFNFGIDVPDLDREGPGSGWLGWSTLTHNLDPVIFRKPGVHTVYVRARDVAGSETVITVILNVIEFEFTREFLLVDDYRDTIYPRDSEHDAFWTRILEGSGRFTAEELDPVISRYSVFGRDDVEYYQPFRPSLETLGRYRLLIWDCKGSGSGGNSALLQVGPLSRHLGAYLAAGGKLWLSGEQNVAATIPSQSGLANFIYPHEILPGMFAWEYLKLYTGKLTNVGFVDTQVHGMRGVRPFPGKPEILPGMLVDPSKQRPGIGEKYGPGGTDIVFEPIYEGTNSHFQGKIDSLYVYDTFGKNLTPPRSSVNDGKLCATRWHDADPDREQGRVMWFGFPVYWMRDDAFQETFDRVLDWFREETVPIR